MEKESREIIIDAFYKYAICILGAVTGITAFVGSFIF